jgi:hypothetical protein
VTPCGGCGHVRLIAALEGLDDAGRRRRGPTRFGFETEDMAQAETQECEQRVSVQVPATRA